MQKKERVSWILVVLATATMLAMTVLVPTAMAQGNTSGGGSTMMKGGTTMMGKNLPSSGGPAILLPAAALLLGSGVLAFAVLRRR